MREKKTAISSTPLFDGAAQDTLKHNATKSCIIQKADYRNFLRDIPNGTIDLVLTDPPYCISRDTGFKNCGPKSVERFAVNMNFGEWDKQDIDLTTLAELSYAALRQSGTCIVWYDLWKITTLADAMRFAGFCQIRMIEWQKSNPVPLNSKRNYLTNGREIAVLGVKGGKPTFNSEYDNGVYEYPIPNNGKRYHPTQKPIDLFCELISKHSNRGDLVIDPFLGSGTTAIAAVNQGRMFHGCDKDDDYVYIARERVADATQTT